MRRFSVLVLITLVGCASSPELKPGTRDDRTFTTTIELLSPVKVTERCKELGLENKNACAAFNLDTKHCTIYVSPQRFENDDQRLALIGHEIWHCRFGSWHAE